MTKAQLVSLRIQRPDLRRPVPVEIVDTMADKTALHLQKQLLSSKGILAQAAIGEMARQTVARHARRQLTNSSYVVRNGRRAAITKELKRLALAWRKERDKFLRQYPQLIKDDKALLKDLFDPADYPKPGELKKQFVFEWQFFRV